MARRWRRCGRRPGARTRSASAIVESRWAMRIVVRSACRRRIASWMRSSTATSMALVASSRTRIVGSASRARARASRWRWPPDSVSPARRSRCRRRRGGRRRTRRPRHRRSPRRRDAAVGVGSGEGDVVEHAGREEERIVGDDVDRMAQIVQREVADVVAVDPDGAVVDVVEAGEQAGDGRLARAGRADDRDGLARARR